MVYLRDLAQGLVQDSPQTAGGSTEGTQRLQELAKETEKDYDDVTEKVRGGVIVRKRYKLETFCLLLFDMLQILQVSKVIIG